MKSKFGLMALRGALVGAFVLGTTLASSATAQAQDPGFGFLYGYSVGQARSFRSNLPTPPYFSIYPPVYYGERFARPYGDSPYASWPTLQSNPNYRPEPKLEARQTIINPHCAPAGAGAPPMATPGQPSTPIALGQKVTIINPYVDVSDEKIALK